MRCAGPNLKRAAESKKGWSFLQPRCRVQCLALRQGRILMVRHTYPERGFWVLPGGSLEQGETPVEGALRELYEECGVKGAKPHQIAVTVSPSGKRVITYHVDISGQEPVIGHDPGAVTHIAFLGLSEMCERDRAYVYAAGILALPEMNPQWRYLREEITPVVGRTVQNTLPV